MRRNAQNLDPLVAGAPGTVRPIRMRLGGLVYSMEPEEAIELATQLADAVQRIKEESHV